MNLNEEAKNILRSYSAGINDFVAGIGASENPTAKTLPPEFKVLGISEF